MISIEEVEIIHAILIEKFGGVKDLRDRQVLESALARPFQTFDGKDLYPHPVEKSAALFESLIINHPFLDGNKRTAYVLMRLLLKRCNLDIEASQESKYEFVLQAAQGISKFAEIRNWINQHLIEKTA